MEQREEYRLGAKRLPGLNPITYGRQACNGGFSVDVLRPYWLLHYVASGKGCFSVCGREHPVAEGQIFVVRPHQPHCYTADKKDPWHYYWIAFDSDVVLPDILKKDVFSAPGAGRLFSAFLAAATMETGKEEYLCGKIWELVSLFIRMESDRREDNAYVARAIRYIEDKFAEGIRIIDIAKHLSLDRSYFSTMFRRETGMSPKEHLEKYRLEKAAEMLMQSKTAVTDVAGRVGYGDAVNFSRMFKKHFGVPPSKYKAFLLANEENAL